VSWPTAASWLVILALLGLAGCVTVEGADRRPPRIVPPDQVAGCAFLGEVTGSGFAGLAFPEEGRAQAQADALEAAAELGATDLAWYASSTGIVGSVAGRAYRCPPAPAP
jgi:hypothetical protein